MSGLVDGDAAGECFATLRIDALDLDPRDVTRRLGMEPTASWHRGDLKGHGRSGHRYERGGWRWTTSSEASDDLNRPLAELLSELRSRREVLREFLSEGAQVDVFAFWATRKSAGPWLEPEQMAGMAELGVPLLVDVYKD